MSAEFESLKLQGFKRRVFKVVSKIAVFRDYNNYNTGFAKIDGRTKKKRKLNMTDPVRFNMV